MSSLKKQTTARERIAHNLRNFRLAREMSQERLAEHADITQTFLSQIESGKRNVSVDVVESLAQALDVDVVDLLAPLKNVK